VTLRVVFDLVIIALSIIALAASRPAFQRWKSDVTQRAHMISDAELEPFLRSWKVKVFGWAWFAIVASLLFVGILDLLRQL
jgi:hypothetical protein